MYIGFAMNLEQRIDRMGNFPSKLADGYTWGELVTNNNENLFLFYTYNWKAEPDQRVDSSSSELPSSWVVRRVRRRCPCIREHGLLNMKTFWIFFKFSERQILNLLIIYISYDI